MSLESLIEALSRLPVVGLVVRAALKARGDNAKDMAASIAFFTFFSLFPLLLGVIAGASVFLEEAEIQRRLGEMLANTLPGSTTFVSGNVEAVFRLRGAAGAASIVGLVWSASKMSGALSRGINQALGLKRKHPSYFAPARQFLLTLVGALLLVVALSVSTTVSLLARFKVGVPGNTFEQVVTFANGHFTGVLTIFVALMWLYRVVPYESPPWRDTLIGAAIAALFVELGKTVFVVYISGIADFEAVYGSLSSVIVLMLWLYIAAHIILLGSEVIAVSRDEGA